MGYVQRIRNAAEPTAQLQLTTPHAAVPRANHKHKRKYHKHAHGLIEPVGPPIGPYAHSGHCKSGHNDDKAQKESHSACIDFNAHAIKQQTGEEWIQKTHKTHIKLSRRKRPSADKCIAFFFTLGKKAQCIDIQSKVERQQCGTDDQNGQKPTRKAPYEKRIQYVRHIFKCQRPLRPVESIAFAPAPDVERRRSRNQKTAQQPHKEERPDCGVCNIGGTEKIKQHAYGGTGENHRLQTYQTSHKKRFHCHAAAPAVIIGIADYKTRKGKKEIDGKVAVVDNLQRRMRRIGLKNMERHHKKGCHSSEAVENFIAWLLSG